MYNRILVATDGSDTSSRACTEAIKLASDQKARLRVLYVISYAYLSAVLGGAYTGDLLRRLRADAKTTLEETEVAMQGWRLNQICSSITVPRLAKRSSKTRGIGKPTSL
jgi:nucleotide-binding universal stress UspA family protein